MQSPVGIIYFLSVSEQEALKKFIEENLNIGFIQPTSFPYSALVFFIKNKDRSLHLYINFCSLINITKKNFYLLPLILDLLDSSCKAQVYTKIDLCYIYHLVGITNRNEWKTTFRTHYESFEWSIMLFDFTNTPIVF